MAVAYLLVALAAGAALPLQAGVDAPLGNVVGGAIRPSLVSFLVVTAPLVVVALGAGASSRWSSPPS